MEKDRSVSMDEGKEMRDEIIDHLSFLISNRDKGEKDVQGGKEAYRDSQWDKS